MSASPAPHDLSLPLDLRCIGVVLCRQQPRDLRLGRLGRTEMILAQTTQGTVTPAGMMLTATRLIEELRPDHVRAITHVSLPTAR